MIPLRLLSKRPNDDKAASITKQKATPLARQGRQSRRNMLQQESVLGIKGNGRNVLWTEVQESVPNRETDEIFADGGKAEGAFFGIKEMDEMFGEQR